MKLPPEPKVTLESLAEEVLNNEKTTTENRSLLTAFEFLLFGIIEHMHKTNTMDGHKLIESLQAQTQALPERMQAPCEYVLEYIGDKLRAGETLTPLDTLH